MMENKPTIPEHLRKVLANDEHLTEKEKTAMTKPLSMEDKKIFPKAARVIETANKFYEEWYDLKPRKFLPFLLGKRKNRAVFERVISLIVPQAI